MIKAECHSDDQVIAVDFDATPWFQQASRDAIIALAECGWRGDYPSDDVAIFMAEHNEDVKMMFTHIENMGKARSRGIHCGLGTDAVGFECSVNEDDAMKWLKENNPQLHKHIQSIGE